MDLTAEQQRIVEHGGGPARVDGAAGTGRTTALVARYLRLLERHRPSQVLVLCRDRAAALRFRDAVLPGLAGGFDALPITTVFGLAFDLVTRAGGPVELLTTRRQRLAVRRLLAADDPAEWPELGSVLRRPAFADAVAEAVLEWRRRPASVRGDSRWVELGRFADRYRADLAAHDQVDSAELLARAATLARSAPPPAYAAVLADDVDPTDPFVPALVAALGPDTVAAGPPALLPAVPVLALTRPFRQPAAPELVTCRHPSMEPEAIARELLAAHDDGVDWPDMAVLVRRPGRRARGIATGLARHGVPVVVAPAGGDDDPVVRGVVDMLRWAGGDDTALERLLVSPLPGLEPSEVRRVRSEARAAGTPLESHPRLAGLVALRHDLAARIRSDPPAELAFQVWRRALAHLVADVADPAEERVLDGLVAFLDGLSRDAERHPERRLRDLLDALDGAPVEPDPWRVAEAATGNGVTVTSIPGAAGREWHTVVVSGCVEGELPHVRRPPAPFDPALLAGGGAVPSAPERRRAALADERRVFGTACSRATGRLLGTAAPAPGVLLSRFVEAWPRRAGRLPYPPGPVSVPRATTVNPVPVFPDGHLHLSASALDTYDDCPLRYCYQYVLRVRDDAGVRADLGTLVHRVLAEFLDPDKPDRPPRTRDALLALARESWVDDIARYRPQVEEARRLYFEMLEQWWEAEGDGPGAPEVLAVERRFDIEVGGHRLTGSIDRIDRAGDGHGIRIVDYKTGKSEPPAGTMPDNLQLAVYHLAATRDPGLMALGPPTELRLLFLRTMHQYEQPVMQGPSGPLSGGHDHAAVTEARVLAAAERIRAEQFDPSVDANCRICPFHRLCPMQEEGREVAAGGMAG